MEKYTDRAILIAEAVASEEFADFLALRAEMNEALGFDFIKEHYMQEAYEYKKGGK